MVLSRAEWHWCHGWSLLLQTILILSSQTLVIPDPALVFVLQLYCEQVEVFIQLLFLLHREQSVDIYKFKAGPLYPDDNTCS